MESQRSWHWAKISPKGKEWIMHRLGRKNTPERENRKRPWTEKKKPWIVGFQNRKRRRQWQPTPVLLFGKFHGWRSPVGCSPCDREESDTTERLHFHFSLSYIGKGNVNPLQCSCVENPRDGGDWWAAIYRVAQSQTQLMQLSSSSSQTERGEGNGTPFQYSCLENPMDRGAW